jgi:hypothetical protein
MNLKQESMPSGIRAQPSKCHGNVPWNTTCSENRMLEETSREKMKKLLLLFGCLLCCEEQKKIRVKKKKQKGTLQKPRVFEGDYFEEKESHPSLYQVERASHALCESCMPIKKGR